MNFKERINEMISYIMISEAGFTKRAYNMPIVLNLMLCCICISGYFLDIPEKKEFI
ncbi:hypothetical protein [Streptococcus iniae]|uniref:hypothetical protein n=1 Tax=Streptococcus iniae TaxID=1346 RepID=UPI00037C8666|nr:hypothetical protein [Streptococcus iniae]ESR08718.1 hypothetical protein IUSA1_10990 [Streptococcus iniae IUSA1]